MSTQLISVAQNVVQAWYVADGNGGHVGEAMNRLNKVLQAEPTPITPEALEAAGWEDLDDRKHFKRDGHEILVMEDVVRFGAKDWKGFAKFPNLKTMEQLHQLLEMMGVGR